ncbi:TonB-dependent receptor [Haliea sp. E1-2-M8]|uniref:TonB-dependent receptor n=1 Tax=Haliea sp. E1-2-M8 TaxID=3064706 RepID=UPI00272A9D70|nr:TonB-dependent receptor [Haliea sp. E1-2-M8]
MVLSLLLPRANTVFAAQGALEEIIVTAQRREENLQESPISITALNSRMLKEIRATDVEGISNYTPGLLITPTVGGSVNASINIRGAANRNNNLSRDNSVGMYLNGVPIAKTSGAIFDAVDIERMEVLRGPQGTLYGKNTIGGAINIITRKPSGELGGSVQIGAGNEGLLEARGSLDLPAYGTIGEGIGEIRVRGSAFYRERDGFYDNDFEGLQDFDNRDQDGGRLDIAIQPSDSLVIEYGYDWFSADQRPTMLALYDSTTFQFVIPPLYPLVDAATSQKRPDSIAANSAETSDVDIRGHALTLSYELPDTALGDLTLKSITGYRDLDTLSVSDFDGTSLDLFRFTLDNEFEQFTQELQLVGSTESLEYVLGLFYYEDEWFTHNPRWIFQFGGNNFDISDRGADDTSKAVFGQMTWTPDAFERKLDITVGGRWTKETKEVHSVWVDRSVFDVDPTARDAGVFQRDAQDMPVYDARGDFIPIEAKDSWTEVTPMATARWTFSDQVNGYLKVSTGFKSGGFNGVAATTDAFRTPFDPEKMLTYEAGLKTRLLDQRLQLNMSAFYNDYSDFQASRLNREASILIVNAGEATMKGAELELTAQLTPTLRFILNYSWLDTEYDEFIDGNGNDISDERYFTYSPEHSVFTSLRYELGEFDWGTLVAQADYAWKDDYFTNIESDPTTDVEDYGLVNARLELREIPLGGGKARIAAWGRNLTDEEYWHTGINLQVFTVNQWADPRSYGVEFEYEF